MPMIDAIRPIATSSLTWLRLSGGLVISSLSISAPDPWTRQLTEVPGQREPMGARSAPGCLRGEPLAAAAGRAAGAVVRRRDAVMPPEGLGELGRLAVADAMGDLAHR